MESNRVLPIFKFQAVALGIFLIGTIIPAARSQQTQPPDPPKAADEQDDHSGSWVPIYILPKGTAHNSAERLKQCNEMITPPPGGLRGAMAKLSSAIDITSNAPGKFDRSNPDYYQPKLGRLMTAVRNACLSYDPTAKPEALRLAANGKPIPTLQTRYAHTGAEDGAGVLIKQNGHFYIRYPDGKHSEVKPDVCVNEKGERESSTTGYSGLDKDGKQTVFIVNKDDDVTETQPQPEAPQACAK